MRVYVRGGVEFNLDAGEAGASACACRCAFKCAWRVSLLFLIIRIKEVCVQGCELLVLKPIM
jgi:hypothetical protein